MRLNNLGSFTLSHRDARMGRNPATEAGEPTVEEIAEDGRKPLGRVTIKKS